MKKNFLTAGIAAILILLQLPCVRAQEVLFPLGSNTVLRNYKPQNGIGATLRIASIDTLNLPFIDDFSKPGVYPDAALWLDSGAFINTTFCMAPVSVGTATLDGLAWNGLPYDSTSGFTRICDYLTSRPIHNNYLASDSVYFSFYYQPQGYGEQPDSVSLNGIGDSLVLEFRNSNGTWENVWSRNGTSLSDFIPVYICITSASYLYDGFQFRFLNYATPNGNRDHWNIDYVRLDRNRNLNDALADVTELYPQVSWLKDYSAIPYPHYKSVANPATLMRDSLRDTVSNIDYASTSIAHTFECIDPAGTSIFNQTKNVQAFTATRFLVDGPLASVFSFPSLAGDSARFILKTYKSTTGTLSFTNDTTYGEQDFYNYYAYDDGTAEGAYGINEAFAKLACRFNNLLEDTLVGVQMYFNPVGDAVHNKLFQLCYWSSIGYAGHPENLVYKRINLKPSNVDSINGFVTYTFDTTLIVPAGEFYVGWVQNDATLLGLGVDNNTPDTVNKFYYYQGSWQPSAIRGAWMIRPLFGKPLPLSVPEVPPVSFGFSVYPNPSDGHVQYSISRAGLQLAYTLYDMTGRSVAMGKLNGDALDFSDQPHGVYILEARNLKDGSTAQTRLVLMP